jgi:hypothetical protein
MKWLLIWQSFFLLWKPSAILPWKLCLPYLAGLIRQFDTNMIYQGKKAYSVKGSFAGKFHKKWPVYTTLRYKLYYGMTLLVRRKVYCRL